MPSAQRPHFRELEALRGLASAYVFLHHANLGSGTRFAWLLSFGQEAVILFFLLSGFVIFYSTHARQTPSVTTYLVHRARRIYPVALFAFAWSYLLACWVSGQWLSPRVGELVLNLAMLQDVSGLKPGVWADPYYGNLALWSLSYEWWFYLLFIPLGITAIRSGWVALTISVAGFVTYQLQPNQMSLIAGYFVIWWAGVALAREYLEAGTVSWRRQRWTCAALAVSTTLWALPVLLGVAAHAPLRLGIHPVLELRHHAAALTFLLLGLAWRKAGLMGFRLTIQPFVVLAPVSYSLYALHYPALVAAETLLPGWGAFARAAVVLAVVLPVSYLLEVRMQKWINRRTDRALGLGQPRVLAG